MSPELSAWWLVLAGSVAVLVVVAYLLGKEAGMPTDVRRNDKGRGPTEFRYRCSACGYQSPWGDVPATAQRQIEHELECQKKT